VQNSNKQQMPSPSDMNQTEKTVIDLFHHVYYNRPAQTWQNTFWMGVPVLKYPTDMWTYQELLYALKPDLIIETGTFWGASALYFAHLCDILDHGQILTIDNEKREYPKKHSRITYLHGSSTANEIQEQVKAVANDKKIVLVILDSDHSQKHVLAELAFYSTLVTVGSYLIVEDTNINGHPVRSECGPGPFEAVEEFLKNNNQFVVDETKEKYLLTHNPRGYLKRIK